MRTGSGSSGLAVGLVWWVVVVSYRRTSRAEGASRGGRAVGVSDWKRVVRDGESGDDARGRTRPPDLRAMRCSRTRGVQIGGASGGLRGCPTGAGEWGCLLAPPFPSIDQPATPPPSSHRSINRPTSQSCLSSLRHYQSIAMNLPVDWSRLATRREHLECDAGHGHARRPQ